MAAQGLVEVGELPLSYTAYFVAHRNLEELVCVDTTTMETKTWMAEQVIPTALSLIA